MSSQKNYIHPHTLQKMVLQKRKQVAELQKQCQEREIKTSSATTIEDLNLQYLALKAENEELKTCHPNVIPRCKTLLLALAHKKLLEDVKNLEELISFQKNMKEMSFEKESELRRLLCPKESPQLQFDELKEKESFRSDILLCLHQKLSHRLRRITREYFPATSGTEQQADGDISKQDRKTSLFSILKALFPDLKDNTLQPEEWEKVECIDIKSSYPTKYVELLLASNIVGLDDENPNFMKTIC